VAWSFRFVDSIAAAPTVRLDMTASPWSVGNGSSFPPPPMKRAIAGTLLVDGEQIPAAAYANRTITLELILQATSHAAAETQMQLLARELDRVSNILMVDPDGSNPVFFRTMRGGDYNPQLITDGRYTISVQVPAEPFGYGLRESISPVTVNNDPAAGSNGMFFDVTSVKGDTETPLFLSVPTASVALSGRRISAVALRRQGTPANLPFSIQAESMTLGADTTVQANDAVMSGAGSNYVRCTFATTATMATRVSATHPAAAGVDVRGTYRVYVRVRKSVGADPVTMQLQINLDGATVTNATVTVPAVATNRYWVDLGLVQYPLGSDPNTDGYTNTALSVRGQELRIQAARTSGTTNLDIDAVILVPADDLFMLIKWSEFSGPTSFIVDSGDEAVYAVGASGEVRGTQMAEVVGGFPRVSPSVTNRVFFVLDVGATAGGDDKTSTVAVTPYYWPRYLYVRPAGA
jgi:hypothetical protein